MQAVEHGALDGFRTDYAIEQILPGTKVVDEPELIGVRLGNDVDGHSKHAREKVRAEGGEISI